MAMTQAMKMAWMAEALTNSTIAIADLQAQVLVLQHAEDPENPFATINGADTAWILTSTCLVLMMTLPGLALFYGGMSQAPNVLATIMQSFMCTCLVSVLWLIVGYTIAFGENGNDYVGGGGKAWLTGVGIKQSVLYPNLPEALFVTYQATFAIITCAIITGSVAERMRFGPLVVFIAFWHIFVYCPLAHFEWGGGFMSKWGVLDFAGGDVVHISSGVAGLAASIIVGKRKAYAMGAPLPPHNTLLVFMGGSLLWVGWFGFNAGSAAVSGAQASMAMLTTHISASTGGLTWIIVEWLHTGKPSVIGAVSGAIAGLVVITPGCGFVDQTAAFIAGLTGAPVCYIGIKMKKCCGIDDALDAFGVHGIGGIWGGIITGLFANTNIPGAYWTAGAFYGNPKQLGLQIAGIVFTAVYSLIVTLLIIVPMDLILKAATGTGVRVTDQVEEAGLDVSEHGESMVAHPVLNNFDGKLADSKVVPVTVQNEGP